MLEVKAVTQNDMILIMCNREDTNNACVLNLSSLALGIRVECLRTLTHTLCGSL